MYKTMSEDAGIVSSPTVVTRDILGHNRKTCGSLRWQEWTFLSVSTVSLLIVVGLTIERIVEYAPEATGRRSRDFAFALVLLVNTLFCIYYVLSGVLRERLFEMYMYLGSVLVILVYSIVNYTTNTEERSPVKLVRLVVVCVLGPVNVILSLLVVRTFGWLEFRVVGASETLQKIYRQQSLFYSFLTFDLQANASFFVLTLTNGTEITKLSSIAAGVGIGLSVFWIAIISVAVKRELQSLCWIFGFLGSAAPAYVIAHSIMLLISNEKSIPFLIAATIAAGALVVAIRGITIVELYYVIKNFGRGLRTQVFNFEAVNYEIHRVRDLCCCSRG